MRRHTFFLILTSPHDFPTFRSGYFLSQTLKVKADGQWGTIVTRSETDASDATDHFEKSTPRQVPLKRRQEGRYGHESWNRSSYFHKHAREEINYLFHSSTLKIGTIVAKVKSSDKRTRKKTNMCTRKKEISQNATAEYSLQGQWVYGEANLSSHLHKYIYI